MDSHEAPPFPISLKGFMRLPKLERTLLVGLILLILFAVFTFSYFDSRYLTFWSVGFWDTLFAGHPLDYFMYNHQHNDPELLKVSIGSLTGIVPRAIWNFPLWIAKSQFGIDVSSNAVALLWGRMMLVVLLWLFLRETWKTAYLISRSVGVSIGVLLLCLSSVFVLVSVGYAGQNDIFWMWLTVWGFRLYLNEDNVGFLATYAYAISVKPFAVLALVVLVILHRDTLLRMVGELIIGLSIFLLQMPVMRLFTGYEELIAQSNNPQMLKNIFSVNTISTPIGEVPLFLIAMAVILSLSLYVSKVVKRENLARNASILVTLSYLAYISLAIVEFYRPLILLPWIFLVGVTAADKVRVLIGVLATLGSNLMVLRFVADGKAVFDPIAFRNTPVFPQPHTFERTYNFSADATPIFAPTEPLGTMILVLSILIALSITLVLLRELYEPSGSNLCSQQTKETATSEVSRTTFDYVVAMRALLIGVWIAFALFVYFY